KDHLSRRRESARLRLTFMNSNTIAIIWLCLVAAFLVTMFFAARGGKPAPGTEPAKPIEPRPAASATPNTATSAGDAEKQP
ncbi:MAG: hypothetical protein ABIQ12_06845, partial [Opitutaceae bacterium]